MSLQLWQIIEFVERLRIRIHNSMQRRMGSASNASSGAKVLLVLHSSDKCESAGVLVSVEDY